MAKKFAIVSHVLPPSPSGQSIMLGKILAPFRSKDYVLFSGSTLYSGLAVQKTLPAKTFVLPVLIDHINFNKSIFHQVVEAIRMLRQISKRTKLIYEKIKTESVEALVVCTGDFSDIAASYLVAKRTPGLDFIPYYFDYFSYQFPGVYGLIAQKLERAVMKRSQKVIVPNEFLERTLQKRYGVATTLVRNPHDNQTFPKVKKRHKQFVIVYTGAIYEAQLEPVRLLARATNKLSKLGYAIKFDLYTPDSQEQLTANGLLAEQSSAVTFHPPVSKEVSQIKQSQADLLYLPLAANTRYPEIIRTSCPGKMSEYLNSGIPILAQVPDDSYVAWFLRENKAGLVSTRMTVQAITSILKDILNNKKSLNQYREPAIKAAQAFSVDIARSDFKAAVS